MLQAWITAPRGSLYFAAPVTAYNLETLRTHVRALRDKEASDTCLSLNVGTQDGALVARVSALAAELALQGIHVRFLKTAGEAAPRPAPVRTRRRRVGVDAQRARARAHG